MSTKVNLPVWALTAACGLFSITGAHAQVSVDQPWVRATVPGQQATGGFMLLSSPTDTALIEADSPISKHVETHEMVMQDNVMRMRQIPKIDLPAGQTVELKPGSYHIMFINLKAQVQEGSDIPMTLTFEDVNGVRQTISITAPARPLASAPHSNHHQKH
ncbi:copper chaperone PCu(A)C [Alcaligenaceae bacterium]|nr:copper chaperone PCu(A)C [Alcaligenaceae bacterium]